ncbi:MAG: DNA-binding transcriptional regulator [Steroidobacteraceae bacterium]
MSQCSGSGGRRPHVALIIETSLGSGRDILRGVARYVREHEPWALYHEPHGLEASVPQWLRRWNGDGIIARIQTRRVAQQLAASGIPVVDVLGMVPDVPFPLVSVDNTAIARMAAGHLLERGFRRFGFFGIEGENWSEQRYAGLCAAVASVQTQVPICRLPRDAKGRRSWERAENHVARWITALPKPAGVLVCSDQRGSLFLEACRRAGVSVPNDIAVVSVDNDEPLCEVCLPPLSSVEPGHLNVGYQAAALLDSMLRGASALRKPLQLQPLETVTRQSSDTLAVADPRIGMALRLIRENAPSGVRIDAIAREVGLSRSVLQRRFRATLHCSIHQEILNVRIRHARELLATTEISLAEVAEQAGFKHQEYLGAVFRARVGRTPAQVREDAR